MNALPQLWLPQVTDQSRVSPDSFIFVTLPHLPPGSVVMVIDALCDHIGTNKANINAYLYIKIYPSSSVAFETKQATLDIGSWVATPKDGGFIQ
ncbi:hypothetical protein [Yersinia massiliensis]|uniref:hypothetical protein n=1 Tax=Yersinia massiliensis TaxID=419257 RepID=UPI0011AACC80|nr:hypothetical protein [Yersinia massiliensis]